MALIDKASLLMVPSTYEDGTLYNVLPSGNKAPDETGNHNGYDQTRADFTFSRGSNLAATRVNADGLIEKGRENLLLQSNSFDTTWVNSNTTETSGQEGYDGTNDAWLLTKTAASGYIYQSISQSGVSTFSVYAKAGTLDWARFRINTTGTTASAYYDLANGVLGGVSGDIDATITSVGNSWYRISLTINATTSVVRIYPADGDFDLTGTSGSIYIQDAQLEKGLVATDYIETGSSTAQAGILEDMPRINYDANGENGALLLESSRTNLITNSEYFGSYTQYGSPTITHNNIISPEGLKNGVKVQRGSNATPIRISNITTLGTEYTMSIWAKAGNADQINIDIGDEFNATFDLTDEWKRVDYTSTPATYTHIDITIPNSSSGDYIYIYGLQLEAASYPSSYIPTHGAAVTRGADSMYVDYADAHPNDEGTIFFEVGNYETNSSASGFNKILVLNEVSSSNLDNVIYFEEYAGENTILIRKGGSTLLQSTPNYQDLRGSKIAIKWNSSEAKIFIDGSLNKTYTGDASLSPRYIGYDNPYNGQIVSPLVIKEQFHFNEALSDSECESLTA